MSMIKMGSIITLENEDEYLILELLEDNGKEYAYATETGKNEEIKGHFVVFEIVKENDEEYVHLMSDIDKQVVLLEKFQKKLLIKSKKQTKIGYITITVVLVLFALFLFLAFHFGSVLRVVFTALSLIMCVQIISIVYAIVKGIKQQKEIRTSITNYEKTNW